MEKRQLTLQQLKNKVLRLLTKRDHSIKELRTKIKHYNLFKDEDFQATLEWLKKLGYLPDESQMAARWVTQLRKEGRGRNYIQQKLKAKGLKPEKLKDDDDEAEAARIFLQKRLKNSSIKDLSFEQKQSLMRKLVTRGFSHSLVRDLFR